MAPRTISTIVQVDKLITFGAHAQRVGRAVLLGWEVVVGDDEVALIMWDMVWLVLLCGRVIDWRFWIAWFLNKVCQVSWLFEVKKSRFKSLNILSRMRNLYFQILYHFISVVDGASAKFVVSTRHKCQALQIGTFNTKLPHDQNPIEWKCSFAGNLERE